MAEPNVAVEPNLFRVWPAEALEISQTLEEPAINGSAGKLQNANDATHQGFAWEFRAEGELEEVFIKSNSFNFARNPSKSLRSSSAETSNSASNDSYAAWIDSAPVRAVHIRVPMAFSPKYKDVFIFRSTASSPTVWKTTSGPLVTRIENGDGIGQCPSSKTVSAVYRSTSVPPINTWPSSTSQACASNSF